MTRCSICGKEFSDSEPLPEGWLTAQNNKNDYQEICPDCHQKYYSEI